jgi:hypothetical protein
LVAVVLVVSGRAPADTEVFAVSRAESVEAVAVVSAALLEVSLAAGLPVSGAIAVLSEETAPERRSFPQPVPSARRKAPANIP